MNILLTGGAGYIGSHIATELVAEGHTPIIVDTLIHSDPIMYEGMEKITGQPIIRYDEDVRNTDAIGKILKDHNCEAVIHLAAHKSVSESVANPLKYYDNNIKGLLSVLQAMEKTGVNLFIFSSSTTVYGDPDVLPMTELSPIKPPTNPYGATKQMSEQIIQDACKATALKAVFLRYFNPIGAHPSGLIGELPIGVPSFLMPYVIQTATGARKELTIFGSDYDTPDGSAVRDYIHVVDLAKAHIKSLDYLNTTEDNTSIFNIGTGKGTSVIEIVRTFEEVTGVKVPHVMGPRRAGDIASSYASPAKAEKILGWKSELTVEQAMEDTWRWQQGLKKSVY